ncbi:helix-turn-helix domain-containing protein [Methylobacterium nigriterrae]|uniref:helix-turn-helix domain-containing protein n=1 Tax=Methylobacterium nigriterrae TaxID=3127512 RepID=UPI003014099E
MILAHGPRGEAIVPAEAPAVFGIPREELALDIGLVVDQREREYWRQFGMGCIATGEPFNIEAAVVLANAETGRYRFVLVPVRDASGRIVEWTGLTQPAAGSGPATGILRQGLEQRVGACHIRAARALLGWSMADLAAASSLSFSTVRRLEQDGEAAAARSRHTAIAALRQAGIHFSLADGNVVAVAKA